MFEYGYFDNGSFVISKKIAPTKERALEVYRSEVGCGAEEVSVTEDYIRYFVNCPDPGYEDGCYQLRALHGKGASSVWVIEKESAR